MSNTETNQSESQLSRRTFVKKTSLGAAAVSLAPLALSSASAAVNAAGDKKLKVGIVGVGGRGAGAIRDIISADPNTVIWSAGDIFDSKIKKSFANLKNKYKGRIDTDGGKREFIGFDSYQKVIDSGVDIVLLTSTPVFRPLHFEAAVAAGKHVFMEKPFALDVPGLKSIIENAKKAQSNGQSVLTGLVWRYSHHLMEMHKRIQDGAIGDVLTTSSCYSGGGRPNRMPDIKFKPPTMSDMEWSLRYWQNFVELSGDGPLEFMIHGIDRMTWAMGDHVPVKCYATGGNINPVPAANTWDSFSMRFEYADGRIADFLGRQIRGTYAPSGDTIIGTKGKAVADNRGVSIVSEGKEIWKGSGGLGYAHEHKIFTDHIRKGEVYNDVIGKSASSHAACIMGRSAGYTGKLITSEQLMNSTDVLIPNVKDLNFDTPFKARQSPQPGKTKFI